MKLRDYLHFEKMTQKKFAESIDINPLHIGAYIHGRVRLGKKTARAIERVTQGKVTAEEILKDNPEKNKIYKKDV